MKVVVVIASSTRGFTTPRAAAPAVINPYPSTQDQDEKGSLPTLRTADERRAADLCADGRDGTVAGYD
jgi:hypothetical protein